MRRVLWGLVAACVLGLALSSVACSGKAKSADKLRKATPDAGVPAEMKGAKTR